MLQTFRHMESSFSSLYLSAFRAEMIQESQLLRALFVLNIIVLQREQITCFICVLSFVFFIGVTR